MLKAGALFYSIVISVIIGIVSASVILLSGLSAEEFQRSASMNDLHLNAASGLNLLLSKQSLLAENEKKSIDLFGKGCDSVELERKYWGAFEIVISRAFRRGQEVSRIAQAGFFPDSTDNYCLYLPDQNKPLAVCGKTEIRGTAFLPEAGVKRAYIEGQSYSGNSLVYGETRRSKKDLPPFNKELLERISSLPDLPEAENNDGFGDKKSLCNSFLKDPVVFSEPDVMTLDGNYSGNIIFLSKKMIIVGSQAVMKDVIVFAPKIIIKSGFKGNLQAFAFDSIIVEEDVTLAYPSVLGIVQGKNPFSGSAVIMNKNDTLSGNIFAYGIDQPASQKKVAVSIAEKAVVYGQVYSAGFADIKGSIFGSLLCKNILLSTSSSVYENHLLNAVIDRSRLPAGYVGINLLEESDYKKVVKWLN